MKSYLPFVLLGILAIIGLFSGLEYTGMVTGGEEVYTENIGGVYAESQNITLQIGNITSLRISGEVFGEGRVRVYADGLIVLDSNLLQKENLITGRVVERLNLSENGSQKENLTSNDSLVGAEETNTSVEKHNQTNMTVDGSLSQNASVIITASENVSSGNPRNISAPQDRASPKSGAHSFEMYCLATCIADMDVQEIEILIEGDAVLNLTSVTYTSEPKPVIESQIIAGQPVQWSTRGKVPEHSFDVQRSLSKTTYFTPGPELREEILGRGRKRVTVSSPYHFEDVLTQTDIEESPQEAITVYWLKDIGRERFDDVTYIDSDENGLVDRLEWIVPHLSEQTFEIVIKAEDAEHLDGDRMFLENIYDYIKEKDDNWTGPIRDGEYVRVTFEEPIGKGQDIKLYVRSPMEAAVDVYLENSSQTIGRFEDIQEENYYTLILGNLSGRYATFDFKMDAPGSYVEFDEIIDPSGNIETLYAMDLVYSGTITSESEGYGAADGTNAVVTSMADASLVDATINDSTVGQGSINDVTFSVRLQQGTGWTDDFILIDYSPDGSNWYNVQASTVPAGTLTWYGNYTASQVDTWSEVDNMQVRITVAKDKAADGGNLEIDGVHVYVNYSSSIVWETSSLDLGPIGINEGAATSQRNITSLGANTDISVYCQSGDCSTIIHEWDNTQDLSHGQKLPANFTCDDSTSGDFSADYNVTSLEDTSADILTVTCSVGNNPPVIQDITITPSPVANGSSINISANVTDVQGVSSAFANLYYPNGSFWMNTTLLNSSHDDIWFNSTLTVPSSGPWGNYTVKVWANDSYGSQTTFTQEMQIYIYLSSSQGDINVDGNTTDWTSTNVFDIEGDPGEIVSVAGWNMTDISGDLTTAYAILVGDADNDGKNEIVAGFGSSITNEVKIYDDDDRDGTWTESDVSGDVNTVYDLALADADNDGKNEIVAGFSGVSNPVRLYDDDDGDGTWTESVVSLLGSGSFGEEARSVFIGDVDADNSSEIVVGFGFAITNEVKIYDDDDRDGTWTGSDVSGDLYTAYEVALADADNDGKNEIVAGFSGVPNQVRLYDDDDGDGTWTESFISGDVVQVLGLDVGDVDDDDFNEIVVGYASLVPNQVRLYDDDDGDGTWTESNITNESDNVQDLKLGDPDNDGKYEIIVGFSSSVQNEIKIYDDDDRDGDWAMSNVSGDFATAYSIDVGDADNDNETEIVSAFTSSVANEIKLYDPDWQPRDANSFDILSLSLMNNNSFLFAKIQLNDSPDMANDFYRLFLSNNVALGNFKTPDTNQDLPFKYDYYVQSYNASIWQVFNSSGVNIGNASSANNSNTIEVAIPLADLNLSAGDNLNITFETGSDTERYDIAPDMSSFVSYTLEQGTDLPTYSKFDGDTTNFSKVNNLSDVKGMCLEITAYGKICWNGSVNAKRQNFNSHVDIEYSQVFVNAKNLHDSLNSSANISLYNTNIDDPVILRDNIVCNDCTLLENNAENITFAVTHFTSYTATSDSNLTIWDSSDTEGGSLDISEGERAQFFANYTLSNGTIIDNTSQYNGSCQIKFDINGWGDFSTMEFNATTHLYVSNRTMNTFGTIDYNVTCYSDASAFNISTTDNISVSPSFTSNALILRPDAEGDSLQWIAVPSGTHYTTVDEETADDGDYVYQPSTSDQDDLFNIETSALLEGATINNVTVYARAYKDGTGSEIAADLSFLIKSGATTDAQQVVADLSEATPAEYSYTWSQNPDDSQAWDTADIDSLQIGVRGNEHTGSGSKSRRPYVTQMWAVISYNYLKPNISEVLLSPSSPYVDQNISCNVTIVDQNNNTGLRAEFMWYNNSQFSFGGNVTDLSTDISQHLSTLTAANTSPNDVWNCSARAHDGSGYSAWDSALATISSYAPSVKDVRVIPFHAANNSQINISANITDPDGVSTATVQVYYPSDEIWINTSLTGSGDIYTLLLDTSNSTWGNYSVRIWANDSFNTINDSQGSSFITFVNASSDYENVAIGDDLAEWTGTIPDDQGDVDFPILTSLVSAGGYHNTCGIKQDGSGYCWGLGLDNNIGDGFSLTRYNPTAINTTGNWSMLSVGGSTENSINLHTCGILMNGSLYCWGEGFFGQIGTGTTVDRPNPSPVNMSPNQFKTVSSGGQHTCAIYQNDSLYCWGRGDEGRLGYGSDAHKQNPTPVDFSPNNFSSVSAGYEHTCAIAYDGRVYCWGQGSLGRLGTGGVTNQYTPTEIDIADNNFTSISSGYEHTCGIHQDGTLYCWGDDTNGQLGTVLDVRSESPVSVDYTPNNFSEVSAGGAHTCAVAVTGTGYCWGSKRFGGLGTGEAHYSQIEATPVPIDIQSNMTSISAGSSHTCGISVSGNTYCWGSGSYGGLGYGGEADKYSPYPVNYSDQRRDSFDILDVSIANNDTHLFLRMHTKNGFDYSNESEFYRAFVRVNKSGGQQTSPDTGIRLPFAYHYRIESYNQSVWQVYNASGINIFNISVYNDSSSVEMAILNSDFGIDTDTTINVTVESGSTSKRFDIMPAEQSYITYTLTEFINTPPAFTSGPSISPSQPVTTDDLTCNFSTEDADGHNVVNITNWYRNNVSLTVLNMPFEGGSNATYTKDYSGYGNDGEVSGATWSGTAGQVGGAYSFDGNLDKVLIQDPESLRIRGDLTVTFWAYPQNLGTLDTFIDMANTDGEEEANNRLYLIRFDGTNGNDIQYLHEQGTGSNEDFDFDANLALNTWYHIAVVRNATAKTVKVFVDGQDLGQTFTYTTGPTGGQNANLSIGMDTSPGREFTGKMDEVKIFNSTLSPEQIYQIYIAENASHSARIISSNETLYGEEWLCSVTPNDGFADGQTTNSSSVIIGSGLPGVDSISCHNTTEWVSCSQMTWGKTLSAVRANCSSAGIDVINASFSLSNQQDSHTFFEENATSNTTDLWVYNNSDIIINDSGTFDLDVSCIGSASSVSDTESWSVGWGTLGVSLIDPSSNQQVNQFQFFDFIVNVSCSDGECGDVKVTLDPILMQNETFEDNTIQGYKNYTENPGAGPFPDNWFTTTMAGHGYVLSYAGDEDSILYNESLTPTENYTIKVQLYSTDNDNMGMAFRVNTADPDNFYSCDMDGSADDAGLYKHVNDIATIGNNVLSTVSWLYTPNTWYNMTITVDEGANEINCYVYNASGVLQFNVTATDDDDWETGSIGFWSSRQDASYYDDLLVYNDSAVPGTKGVVPMFSGTPFYTVNQNPMVAANTSCLASMKEGSSCQVTWSVNATGDIGENYTFFATAESQNYSAYVSAVDSPEVNLTIKNASTGTVGGIECQENGTSWGACSNVAWHETITAVRANCTSESAVQNMSFTLSNQDDATIFFSQNATYNVSTTWTYNNTDVIVNDSGTWVLSATCIDENAQSTGQVSWDVPWGVYNVTWISPLSDTAVSQNRTRYFSARVDCLVGECGDTEVVIDPPAGWWDDAWGLRKKITINNTRQPESFTNFTVLVKLSSSNFNISRAKDDGSDIRFISSDNTTELPYEIEFWDNSGISYVWVKITNITASSDTDYFWIYYNNSEASDGQNPQNTWDRYYKLVQHLQETSGTVNDSTLSGNDGTVNNAQADSGGLIDGNYLFVDGGTADYINISDDDSLDMGGQITMEAWVNFNTLPITAADDMIFIDKYNGGTNQRSYRLGADSGDNKIWCHVDGDGLSGGSPQGGSDNAAVTGGWYYAACTFSAGEGYLYINGTQQSDLVDGSVTDIFDSNTPLAIGGANSLDGADEFDGYIDEVRISNTNRTSAWINASYLTMVDRYLIYGPDQQSSEVKGDISTIPGDTPFWTASNNPQNQSTTSCLGSMKAGDRCTASWAVNATGEINSTYVFFVYANSQNYMGVARNDSYSLNITISTTSLPYFLDYPVISPSDAYTTSNLTCQYNTTDADGDAVVNITNWYRNNESITVLNLPFEGNGNEANNATDYSGHGNTGTVFGATWNRTGGRIGGAYEFDGLSNYLEIGHDSNLSFNKNEAYSFGLWMRSSDPSQWNRDIIFKGEITANGYPYRIFLASDGTLKASLYDGSVSRSATATSDVRDGDWHHILASHNGSTLHLYVDGVNEANDSTVLPGSSSNTGDVHIGALSTGSGEQNFFNGSIDEVMIFNYALGPEQVSALYSNNQSWSISSQDTVKGEEWVCSVTPNDGYADGLPRNSSFALIENMAPVFTVIPNEGSTPASPTNIGDNVTFSGTATDGDGDTWQLVICDTNGFSGGGCVGSTICQSGFVGSEVQTSCEHNTTGEYAESYAWYAFAYDGTDVSESSSTYSPYYVNHRPYAANITLNDSSPEVTDTILCNYSFHDSDGDAEGTSLYRWYEQEQGSGAFNVIPGKTADTLNISAAGLVGNDMVRCGVNAVDAHGLANGTYANSTDATIIDGPPSKVELISPTQGNKTIFANPPTFLWNASNDGDPLNYTLNITSETCPDPGVFADINATNHTPASEFVLDCTYYWQVRAYDGIEYGQWSDQWNFTLNSLVLLSMTNDEIQFGRLDPNEISDTDNNASPFIVQNDGNTFANVTWVSINESLWDTQGDDTEYFQFKIDNDTTESNSFNWTGSTTTWTNLTTIDNQNKTAVARLDYNDARDEAEIDIRIHVPEDEPPGIKSSLVYIIAQET